MPVVSYRRASVKPDPSVSASGRNPETLHELTAENHRVPVRFVRHPRARRYILRMQTDGSARVTIPRSGSSKEGLNFVQRHAAWIARQLQGLDRSAPSAMWSDGTTVWLRGEPVRLRIESYDDAAHVTFADQTVLIRGPLGGVRAAVERHLRQLAVKELVVRTLDLASVHRVPVGRVTVRNQRSRWGSCSNRGAISLNWRLLQTPVLVRDYIILHELMHCREMNHSDRFWRLVAEVCPDYQQAERWLKENSVLLWSERGLKPGPREVVPWLPSLR